MHANSSRDATKLTISDLADVETTVTDDPEDPGDSAEFLAAYFPEPGDTDDGIFDFALPSGDSTSCSSTVWTTRQKPSFLGLAIPTTPTLRIVRDMYDVAYSQSTAHAIGSWTNRHGPGLYSRVWYWMREKGGMLYDTTTGFARLADACV